VEVVEGVVGGGEVAAGGGVGRLVEKLANPWGGFLPEITSIFSCCGEPPPRFRRRRLAFLVVDAVREEEEEEVPLVVASLLSTMRGALLDRNK
jgi:hypothetical protein